MTPKLIIDCSVTIAWLFKDEQTPAVFAVQDQLEDGIALVPMHWPLEVANVLALAERKQRITPGETTDHLALLSALAIEAEFIDSRTVFESVLELCRRHRLTSYDAAYLELAMRTQLPLATLDAELRTAGNREGVELLGL